MSTRTFPGPLELLLEAWALYRQRFITLVGLAITAIAPVILFMMAWVNGYLADQSALLFGGGVIVYTALQYLAMQAIVHALHHPDWSLPESYQAAVKSFWSLLWLMVLSMLIYMGAAIFFVIPALITLFWIMLAPLVLALEEHRGLDAILVAREYARGRWWALLWRLICFGFIMVGVSMVMSLLMGAAMGVGTALNPNITTSLMSEVGILTFSFVYQGIFQVLFLSFFLTYLYVMYRHLKQLRGTFTLSPSSKTRTALRILAIIGVPVVLIQVTLMFFLMTIFPSTLQQSQQARSQINLTLVGQALELYRAEEGMYPRELTELEPYLLDYKQLIRDPQTNLFYQYEPGTDRQSYQLCRESLDEVADQELCWTELDFRDRE
jgi:hypothetical protein